MRGFIPGRFTPGVQVGKSVGSVGERAGWRAQLVQEREFVGSKQGVWHWWELQSEMPVLGLSGGLWSSRDGDGFQNVDSLQDLKVAAEITFRQAEQSLTGH
ncbi:hypothetical protein ATANTOWER_005047 [Ataeniobius toweri]|uniref:Uncharacterized protein n=1 Tax=Ataeniobius toweri TaxID=208326 RepID=A0ABU7CFP5_9TELE|nr:hypothetical protein [Ataeniobius toweri]